MAGGTYLAYSFERSLSDFNNIIMLHHVENLREHLLLNIQKVKIDLYSQKTLHPESTVAIESHVIDMEKSISGCYGCHHTPDVDGAARRPPAADRPVQELRSAVLVSQPEDDEAYRKHPVDAQIIGDSLIGKVETMVVATSEKLREQTEESFARPTR